MAHTVKYPSLIYINPLGDEINFRDDGADIPEPVEGLSNPEPNYHLIQTPYTHGSTLISGVANERVISVPVMLDSNGSMTFRQLAQHWNDVLNPFEIGPDRVTTGVLRYQSCEDDPVYEIDAAPLGKPSVKLEMADYSARVYDFLCPYPFFRRLPDNVVTASISATGFAIPWAIPTDITSGNCSLSFWMFGNIPSPPVITVDGPFSDIWILHDETETFMRVNLTLTEEQTLTIDCKEKTVEVDGVNVAGYIATSSTFPTCVAGNNTFNISVDSGTPTVKINAPHLFSGVR